MNHIEASTRDNLLSYEFKEDDIISIEFVRSPAFVKPHLCIIHLKSDVEIKFKLHKWDIVQYSDDGYLFINGACVQEPLTQEERGIGMIDVMNGDGYYDENGDFHSYHHYED